MSAYGRSARQPTKQAKFFDALPPYQGGKRRLAPLIFAEIAKLLPMKQWGDSRLLEPFGSGGAISLYGKFAGEVIYSDRAERGAVTGRALIANSKIRLNLEDVQDLHREPASSYPKVASGYIPNVFSPVQADWLDRAVARARLRAEPVRSLLMLLIMKLALRAQPMSGFRGTDILSPFALDSDKLMAEFEAVSAREQATASRLISFALLPEDEALVESALARAATGLTGATRRGRALGIIAGHCLESSSNG